MYQTAIAYDKECRDYAMYLDGDLIGFARTEREAAITLEQLMCELLDGGSGCESTVHPARLLSRPTPRCSTTMHRSMRRSAGPPCARCVAK